jgi:hypothetical protein
MLPYRTIPICAAAPLQVVQPPRLDGEPAVIRDLLVALERAVCATLGQTVPAGAWLREMHVDHGEAVLALAPGLNRPELVQVAFETLRALLRDTDIYVGTAGH